ncbi:MAG TPA: hypothetical protein VJX67_05690 [Blastocatellia bacterium]|nr:hypothetical protein [Blastocatellia bacterium]
MLNGPKTIAYCCLAALIALYIVGAVSNGSLRHEVQTLPLWIPIVLGFRHHDSVKWAALPCFLIWLVLMALIWLFLLGWAQILRGHFSAVEVAMTIVVGSASVVGTVTGLRWKTSVGLFRGLGVSALFALLQIAAIRISLIPYIATR